MSDWFPGGAEWDECNPEEIMHEHHGWDGKCYDGIDGQVTDKDIINWLRSENAYLRGKITVYEKFLKDKGFIKEEESEHTQIQTACD